MVGFRSRWLVAVVGLGLAAGACKKKDEAKSSTPGATAGGAAEKVAAGGDKPAAAGGGAVAGAGASDDLSLLPVDSEMVMGLNFAQLRTSALWKLVEPKLMDNAAGGLAKFKDKCGFDPMEAVKSISIGFKGLGAPGDAKPDGVVVIHGPDKAKTLACLDAVKDEAAKDGTEFTRDGDAVLVKMKNGEGGAMAFVNDATMVFVVGPSATKDGLKAVTAGTSALKTSAAFTEMYGKINTGESLWLLVNGNSKAFDAASQMGMKLKAVFGSVNVTDGLSADLRVRFESADQANQIVGMGKGQLAAASKMFAKLDLTADGADAHLVAALTKDQLQGMITQFGGALGGVLGAAAAGGGAPTP